MQTLNRNLNAYACVAMFAAAALGSSTAAAQVPAHFAPPVVKEGTTIKLSDHVYVIPDDKAPMVPNVGIIVGAKGTLIVDPGMGMRSGQTVLREAAKVSKGPELYIVNTHFHPEHTTGEVAFPPHTRILRASAQQQDIEELGLGVVKNFASRSPVIAEVLQDVKTFRAPAELFEREKTIDLGGVRARIIRLGPGHTRGDTVVFVEGDRVLFSGDLAMKGLFPAFATPQSSSRTWLTSLDEMDKLRAVKLVPAHYEITDASTIEAYRGYIRALQARVGELKRQGKSSDETAELVRGEFKDKYPDWAQPIRTHTAATRIYAELP